jgi:preprotein translocase subunit Sec61beta
MASDNRVHLPSGSGGITRYFDEYESKLRFSPGIVIVLVVIVIIIEIILHFMGGAQLGI